MLELEVEKTLGSFHMAVSFQVDERMVALFGPSGAGKSLTLQCIAGLVEPDRGRVVLDGQTVFDSRLGINLPPQKRSVGYVFQNYALFPHLTVEGNIGYGLHRLPASERRQRVEEAIHRVRLGGLEKRFPAQLSGGQQQRVALARTLVTQPRILLLDEPFSALDSAVRGRLQSDLMQLMRQVNITAILVTHNLQEAYALSERMIVYDAGRILQDGHRDEVLYRPRTRSVARFTGAKNIFRATVKAVDAEHTLLDADLFSIVAPSHDCQVGQVVEFCIRPENIMLVRPSQPLRAAVKENLLEGVIIDELPRGSVHTLYFHLKNSPEDYDLEIEVPNHAYERLGLGPGKEAIVSLKMSAIHVIPEPPAT
ncbi:MAG: ABC transporter ATP-binding protein [Dehalococcoidia bacterium]|nr:ABC transporter ATP-binding protein [Dehalococcoidia bacterium]